MTIWKVVGTIAVGIILAIATLALWVVSTLG